MSSYENGKRTRLGRIWNNIKKRCYNPRHESYKYYGAKGVKVCDEWIHDFDAFKDWAMSHGYTDDKSIDRIDSNGDYNPDNCRWATAKQQANNRSDNHMITYDGTTMTMMEWAEHLNINFKTLTRRIYCGWPVEKALFTPVNTKYASHGPNARRS